MMIAPFTTNRDPNTNQPISWNVCDTAGHGDDSYLDSGDGVSLYDVRVDALHVVLDDTLVQVAERGLEATKETSLLHGLRVEPEEVVLAGLEDFRLSRQDGFVLDPRV